MRGMQLTVERGRGSWWKGHAAYCVKGKKSLCERHTVYCVEGIMVRGRCSLLCEGEGGEARESWCEGHAA